MNNFHYYRDIAKALKDRGISGTKQTKSKRVTAPPTRQKQEKIVSLIVKISRNLLRVEKKRKQLKRKAEVDSEVRHDVDVQYMYTHNIHVHVRIDTSIKFKCI